MVVAIITAAVIFAFVNKKTDEQDTQADGTSLVCETVSETSVTEIE